MVRTVVARVLFLLSLVSVTAGLKCGDGPLDDAIGPSTRGINGTWLGTIDDLSIRLTLSENAGTASGSGTITQAGQPFAVTVSGTAGDGVFSITISEAQHEPFTFAGTVRVAGSNTVMAGTVTGAGFQNEALTLTRQ